MQVKACLSEEKLKFVKSCLWTEVRQFIPLTEVSHSKD